MTILVVGSTGTLGGMTALALQKSGKKVRALVRQSSDAAKVAALEAAGLEVVVGDLKDKASIERATKGVSAVVSTASATMSRQPGDSLESVDGVGMRGLVDAAKAAGVGAFYYVSFPEQSVDSPLQRGKRATEKAIVESGLAYTILRPTFFTEVWLSTALGFDFAQKQARLFGSGDVKHPWIGIEDVLGYTVGAVDNEKAKNKTFDLGGPDLLSQRDVVKMFEERLGKPFSLEVVPAEALEQGALHGKDDMEKTFSALMHAVATGVKMDLAPANEAIPLSKRATVRDYVDRATR